MEPARSGTSHRRTLHLVDVDASRTETVFFDCAGILLGALNWITVSGRCPSCAMETKMQCQTHLASSYEGDEIGSFHGANYSLGSRLRWWPRDDPRWHLWSEGAVPVQVSGRLCFDEACTADCMTCGAELCVVIRFENLVAREVRLICLEQDWPSEFPQ